jgi:uncharacterized protein YqfA (UPF0365 family)
MYRILAAVDPLTAIGIGFVLLLFIVVFIVVLNYMSLWARSVFSRAGIGLIDLVRMSIRGISPNVILTARIMSTKSGLEIPVTSLESHYKAGGKVYNVIKAIIAAKNAAIPLTFTEAAVIDLAGRDVLEAVRTSVYPKVIDAPDATYNVSEISAKTRDGIEVKAKARVTVRANIKQLVGGASEATIIARVCEGIVSAIGSSASYKDVLENPDSISRAVLERGLDAGTAFEILSIDIADVDVGRNIGAQLMADQAEADKRVAQAKAEGRRAMAVAYEREMQAKVVANQAKLIEAKAEVPRAIGDSLASGKMTLMQYYSLKNIQADTEMRTAISNMDSPASVIKGEGEQVK